MSQFRSGKIQNSDKIAPRGKDLGDGDGGEPTTNCPLFLWLVVAGGKIVDGMGNKHKKYV